MTGVGAHIGSGEPNEMDGQMPELLDRLHVLELLIGPAIGEDAVDPALHQRRHRPPVDRIDQHQCIGPVDPRLFEGDVGGLGNLAAMDGKIVQREARVEAFPGEIGDLDAMAGAGDAVGQRLRDGMAEGVGVGMGDDDEGVHGLSPVAIVVGRRSLYTLSKLLLVHNICQASIPTVRDASG